MKILPLIKQARRTACEKSKNLLSHAHQTFNPSNRATQEIGELYELLAGKPISHDEVSLSLPEILGGLYETAKYVFVEEFLSDINDAFSRNSFYTEAFDHEVTAKYLEAISLETTSTAEQVQLALDLGANPSSIWGTEWMKSEHGKLYIKLYLKK